MVPAYGSAPPGQDLLQLCYSGVELVECYHISLSIVCCRLCELFAWLFQCPKSGYLLSAQKSKVWCFLKLLFSVFLLCQASGTSAWWVLEQGLQWKLLLQHRIKPNRARLGWKVLGQGTGSQPLSEEGSWSRRARAGTQKGERLTRSLLWSHETPTSCRAASSSGVPSTGRM